MGKNSVDGFPEYVKTVEKDSTNIHQYPQKLRFCSLKSYSVLTPLLSP